MDISSFTKNLNKRPKGNKVYRIQRFTEFFTKKPWRIANAKFFHLHTEFFLNKILYLLAIFIYQFLQLILAFEFIILRKSFSFLGGLDFIPGIFTPMTHRLPGLL